MFERNVVKEDELTKMWMGFCAFHLGDYKRALSIYNSLQQESENNAPKDCLSYLACCYFFLGMYSQVDEVMKKVTHSRLKIRLMFHLAHKLGDEDKLMEYHKQLADVIEDQLSLASIHYLRAHYQEAIDIYKRILLDNREYLALNVYIAFCYYKLDYYDVSQDVLNIYLQKYSDSVIATNLKACNYFRLYNGKVAEAEIKSLQDQNTINSFSFGQDLLRHNSVVFRNGEFAMQILPPLVDIVPEARLNLVIHHLKQNDYQEAFELIKNVEPSVPHEYILKAVVNAAYGQHLKLRENIKIAQHFFQLVGSSSSECDTIPGRQCMASSYFLQKEFTEVQLYLSSIKSYYFNDDCFNFNFAQVSDLHFFNFFANYRNSVRYQETEESKFTSDIECKRQIHSKIEKRRRDKMNTYIAQLSTMIPSCNFTAYKPDKITVLRMAVQYLKSIRSSPIQSNIEENLKYSFVSDVELKKLILQVSEGFLFVIGCDSGKLLYVSESVSKILNCNQSEILGRSLYDVIHPSDIDKVKEQISCADLNSRHKLMNLKTMKELDVNLPSEQLGLHSGNRRSFFFRIKSDLEDSGKYTSRMNNIQFYHSMNELVSLNNADQNQYNIIHCIGYLKCCNFNSSESTKRDDDSSSLTCLIAVGRTLNDILQSQTLQTETPSKFISKHTADGKFLFVDHWITLITGYLPQEILGTSIYEYVHPEDTNQFAEDHRSILQELSASNTIKNYRFRTKFNGYINIQSEWKILQNPWKKDIEFFYSTNVIKWMTNETNDEEKLNKKESNHARNVQNELFKYSNYSSEQKNEQNLIDEFNFDSTLCEKSNNEAAMEAILKLLESDTNIAD